MRCSTALNKRWRREAQSLARQAAAREDGMRLIVAALSSSAKAAADVNPVNDCSDRNALNDIAVDARLVAIKFYYDGFIRGMTDRNRQTCYEPAS
jgi:hypothetical protein